MSASMVSCFLVLGLGLCAQAAEPVIQVEMVNGEAHNFPLAEVGSLTFDSASMRVSASAVSIPIDDISRISFEYVVSIAGDKSSLHGTPVRSPIANPSPAKGEAIYYSVRGERVSINAHAKRDGKSGVYLKQNGGRTSTVSKAVIICK